MAAPKGTTDLERVNDVVGAPVILGPLLCAASYQGRSPASTSLRVVARRGAKIFQHGRYCVRWQKYLFALAAGHCQRVQLNNGTLAWRQDALRNRRLAGPAVNGQAVIVGDSEGYVHFLSPDDGRLVARLSLGGGPIHAPIQTTLHGVLVQLGSGSTLVMLTTN